jgi:hypothetical protein
MDLMGYDLVGEEGGEEFSVVGEEGGEEVGAARLARPSLRALPGRGRAVTLPRMPWRTQVAPGVALPREAMLPLPLRASAGGGVFTPTLTSIIFSARPQKPFRAERVVAVVSRSVPMAANPVLSGGGLIIGTQPQTAEIGEVPLEVFAPGAFGVRLSMAQAEPGIDIVAQVNIQGTIPAGESIAVSITLLGRSIL